MKIQVLGTGCSKCNQLADLAKTAAKELNLDAKVEKITDVNQITSFGVMITPAILIDGQITLVGKVPSLDEMKQILK